MNLSTPFIFLWKFIIKALSDVILTVYDDYKFESMSLPRLGLAASLLMVTISWIAQQFFGHNFEYFPQLIQLVMALAATYGVKKYVEGKDE